MNLDSMTTVAVYVALFVVVVFFVCRGQFLRIGIGSRGEEYEYDGDQSTKIRHEGGI